MEARKTPNYNAFYRDAYEFHKRWMPCPHDLEEWEKCAEDVCAVSNKHGNNRFMMGLLVAVYNELEAAYKEYAQGREQLCE